MLIALLFIGSAYGQQIGPDSLEGKNIKAAAEFLRAMGEGNTSDAIIARLKNGDFYSESPTDGSIAETSLFNNTKITPGTVRPSSQPIERSLYQEALLAATLFHEQQHVKQLQTPTSRAGNEKEHQAWTLTLDAVEKWREIAEKECREKNSDNPKDCEDLRDLNELSKDLLNDFVNEHKCYGKPCDRWKTRLGVVEAELKAYEKRQTARLCERRDGLRARWHQWEKVIKADQNEIQAKEQALSSAQDDLRKDSQELSEKETESAKLLEQINAKQDFHQQVSLNNDRNNVMKRVQALKKGLESQKKNIELLQKEVEQLRKKLADDQQKALEARKDYDAIAEQCPSEPMKSEPLKSQIPAPEPIISAKSLAGSWSYCGANGPGTETISYSGGRKIKFTFNWFGDIGEGTATVSGNTLMGEYYWALLHGVPQPEPKATFHGVIEFGKEGDAITLYGTNQWAKSWGTDGCVLYRAHTKK